MTVSDVILRYEYNWWANRKLFGVIATLSPEEFTRNVAGTYGSVRNTLVHAMSAEWGWLDRCGGEKRGPKLENDKYLTATSVIERWAQVEGFHRAFFARLTDADLDRMVEFSFGGPPHRRSVGQLLAHAANHGVHHRGQVSMLLRMLGHAPGDVDLLYYFGERT